MCLSPVCQTSEDDARAERTNFDWVNKMILGGWQDRVERVGGMTEVRYATGCLGMSACVTQGLSSQKGVEVQTVVPRRVSQQTEGESGK